MKASQQAQHPKQFSSNKGLVEEVDQWKHDRSDDDGDKTDEDVKQIATSIQHEIE